MNCGDYMASGRQTVEYIADQLAPVGDIAFRKMFGEYGLYCYGKIFALVCDDTLFVKITEEAEKAFPSLPKAPPYDGARDYFLIEDIDDRDFLCELVSMTYRFLPEPKPKKPKKKNSHRYN